MFWSSITIEHQNYLTPGPWKSIPAGVHYQPMRAIIHPKKEDLDLHRILHALSDPVRLPSRRAALRLGFSFEGIFLQHMIQKGRNRDTAWYSMLDGEWPSYRAAYEQWLSLDNFDGRGGQRRPLREFLRRVRNA